MIPSVGRIVHYVSHGSPVRPDGTQAYYSVCRAAIVTDDRHVDNGDDKELVDLCVVNPTGLFFHMGCQHDETPRMDGTGAGGTWHWPERAGESMHGVKAVA